MEDAKNDTTLISLDDDKSVIYRQPDTGITDDKDCKM